MAHPGIYDDIPELDGIGEVFRWPLIIISRGFDRRGLYKYCLTDFIGRVFALRSDFIREEAMYEADRQNEADNFAFHLNRFKIALESLQHEFHAYELQLDRCICDIPMPQCDLYCDPIRDVDLILQDVENMIGEIWSSDLEERVERQRERDIRQVVEGLPTIKISENILNEIAVCPICLSDYEVAEVACHLPCDERHVFHRECIEEWLKRKNQCPICRWPAYKWTYWREAVGYGEFGTLIFSF